MEPPIIDFAVTLLVILGQAAAALWIIYRYVRNNPGRFGIVGITLLSIAGTMFAFLLRFKRVSLRFPHWVSIWGRGVIMMWALLSIVYVLALLIADIVLRIRKEHDPSRRNFLRAARAALFLTPAAAMGYGTFIQRNQLVLREQKIVFPDLPHDLDGLKIAQLTDIHLSQFLDRRMLDRAIAMANETRPNISLVTGDLITTLGDPLDDCLDALTNLRSDTGTYGCLGNHEAYAEGEDYTATEGLKRGMLFLRHSSAKLRFGNATLNLAGVDYQQKRKPYLRDMEKLVDPSAFNVLLSHNPDVFPVAVNQGYRLTIGGHTHGGQVRVEIVSADLNVARFFTPYYDGLYRSGSSAIFVSRGIGTITIPVRLGAPPEVALIRLCRS